MPRPASNPPNPWSSTFVEYLGEAPPARLEVFEEEAASIVSENRSPDLPFRWSLNPYRGCFHGCAYCYARPGHQQLGWGAGTDFERKIVVKVNAPELLRERFLAKSWEGETLTFSGVTDCYQPLEASYGLTRRCLETCLEFRNPVAIITKSALIRRDAGLLAALARETEAAVYVSIPFADDQVSRKLEPYVPVPSSRFEALRVLSEAGVPTGVAVAPVIPGLNESDIPEVLERAWEAGARRAFYQILRLPDEVEDVFVERLREGMPERADKVLNAVRNMRGGKLNDARFGSRMKGEGARARLVADLFEVQARKIGFRNARPAEERKTSAFRRPGAQLSLFG